ncbi:type II toxin-antitoxin system RelE/ParE family toxin [Steroidobacter cummioxidans]|uniref:type II toxin-antitoxin system RelE/ParE family toxin n=1 Tax=Steroidobacter cummioxidans TaxID=1803913 RepID=UPI000E31EC83|nr:type II toxin-antitoxin system RelE/ParE family toxin [Steroidobacter cummioxidans]
MIKSFRHAGLESFFLSGSKAGIQPKHAARLRLQLGQLDAAMVPYDMDRPGWRFHPLKGGLNEYFAVWVDENWRLTFTFDDSHAELVDYQDYH